MQIQQYPEIKIRVISSTEEIKNLPSFNQLDPPVALTAPLIVQDEVFIGVFNNDIEWCCINLKYIEFQSIKKFLYDPQYFRLVTHGIKKIWEDHDIGHTGTLTQHIIDTELIAYLLDSGRDPAEYSVAFLARKYLDIDFPDRARQLIDMDYREFLIEVLTDDAEFIHDIGGILFEQMDAEQQVYYLIGEQKIALILNEMTRYGIPVDGHGAAQLYGETIRMSRDLNQQITDGREFNLWSPADVFAILVEDSPESLNSAIRKAKKILPEQLKQLAPTCGKGALILEWRDLQTDIRFLQAASGESRVHPRWNMMSRTARIIASSPAVQNISKIRCRPLIKAPEGSVIIKGDYRQMQMRILANHSLDPELVEVFRKGHDVHMLTAEMCGIEGSSDEERRNKAKVVNFGILFQMTADGLSRELGTDRTTAQRYIQAFWQKYSVAKQFLDDFVERLKAMEPQDRIVRAHLGRIRRFDGQFGRREQRQAKATLLQQQEADILRLALMYLFGYMRKLKMRSRVIMTIHDAIWVEAPCDEENEARQLLKHHMEHAIDMPYVPLEVDIE